MKKILFNLLSFYESYHLRSIFIGFITIFLLSFLYETDFFVYFIVPVFGGMFVFGIMYTVFLWLRRIWQRARGETPTETVTKGY